jgi:hypothetical protein
MCFHACYKEVLGNHGQNVSASHATTSFLGKAVLDESRQGMEILDQDQLDAVAEPINDHWAEQMGDDARPFVEPIWHGSILPSLKANALAEKWTAEQFRERCIRALRADG